MVNGVTLAVAAILLGLAALIYLGSRAGRVVTWLAGMLVVCLGGALLALEPAPPQTPAGGPTPAEMAARLAEAVPGWVDPLAWIALGVTVVGMLVAMVLLALPPGACLLRQAGQDRGAPTAAARQLTRSRRAAPGRRPRPVRCLA